MPERFAYLNGAWVPESEAKVSIFDRGFTLGDGVYEAMRTFAHKPFKVDEHLRRLYRSLKIARIQLQLDVTGMRSVIDELVARNGPTFDSNDDFMIYPTITRGVGGNPLKCGAPTVVLAVRTISWSEYANYYQSGVHLVVPSIRRQPPQCWDAKIKTTSRFHHTLADLEVGLVDPAAYCLLLDLNGNVSEHRSSNVAIVRDGRIETPSSAIALRGITLATVADLARDIKIEFVERDLQLYDFYTADEVFLTSTSFCVLPASKVNGVSISDGEGPGPIVRKLLAAFSKKVGLSIVDQALSRARSK